MQWGALVSGALVCCVLCAACCTLPPAGVGAYECAA